MIRLGRLRAKEELSFGSSISLSRRVYPQLFADKLVGVQPMSAPVGLAYAVRNVNATNSSPSKEQRRNWRKNG
jgi:hypothetical protein